MQTERPVCFPALHTRVRHAMRESHKLHGIFFAQGYTTFKIDRVFRDAVYLVEHTVSHTLLLYRQTAEQL